MLVAAQLLFDTRLMKDDPERRTGATAAAPAPQTPTPQSAGQARALLLADLVGRMGRGEQDALARLWDETSPLINGLLRRMLEYAEDAEEALLDVYMKAWKNAASYSPGRGSVQSWLVIMARSIAIDRIRQKRALPKTAGIENDNAPEFVSGDPSPEEQTEDAQRTRKVQTVLRELPAEQREVLELAFFAGYTHSELAKRLGQPLGTVKSRIRMALMRLKSVLEEGAAT